MMGSLKLPLLLPGVMRLNSLKADAGAFRKLGPWCRKKAAHVFKELPCCGDSTAGVGLMNSLTMGGAGWEVTPEACLAPSREPTWGCLLTCLVRD